MKEKIQLALDAIVAEYGKKASASLNVRIGGVEYQFISSTVAESSKTAKETK